MPRITGTVFFNGSYMFVDYGIAGQSVAGNYTDINWILGFHYGNAHFRLDALQCGFSATAGVGGQAAGGPWYSGWPAPGGQNQDITVASGTLRAFHNAAGACTVGVSGSVSSDFGGSSLGGSFGLPTIPRLPGAPGTPSASGHTDSNPTTFTVTWTAPSDVGAGLSGHLLQISKFSDFRTIQMESVSESSWVTSYSASGAEKGTTYYARVTARSVAGWGPTSGVGSWTTGTTVPGAPGTPSASGITGTSADIGWNAPSDTGGTSITGYRVERSTVSNFSAGVVATDLPASPRTMQFTGLSPTTTYWVRVRAVNSVGSGSFSSVMSFTTGVAPPSAPGTPVVSNRTPLGATVTWTAPTSNGGAAITGYEVAWSTSPSFTPQNSLTGGTGLSRVLNNLLASTVYHVRVRATNSAGAGAWSTATQFRTTSGARVGGASWIEADVWTPNSNGTAFVPARIRSSTTGTGWS